MKILVVDQFYYPEEFQINDICTQMVKDGHQVTVLTGLPNYPTGIIPDEYRHGKKRDEYVDGVHIIRSLEIPRKKGPIGMSLNYISFAVSGCLKFRKLKDDYDVIFVYQTSPVTMACPAEKIAKKCKIPVFLYCCDIWPEVVKVMISNENSISYKLIKKLSTKLYKKADLIAVQSKGFFKYFKDTHGIGAEKLRYLPQYANDAYADMDLKAEDNNTVDFVFLGNIGIAQDIGGLIEAVYMIKDYNNFKVHLVGTGSYIDEAKSKVKEKGLEDIILFYGRRPYEEMPKFYKLADVCLATLQANSAISLTIPSKVQGYMAAGKPIIAALSGFAKDIINESGSGIGVEPGNIKELSEAMKEFILNKNTDKYVHCGECARQYYNDNFTKEKYMTNLYSILEETVEKGYR